MEILDLKETKWSLEPLTLWRVDMNLRSHKSMDTQLSEWSVKSSQDIHMELPVSTIL